MQGMPHTAEVGQSLVKTRLLLDFLEDQWDYYAIGTTGRQEPPKVKEDPIKGSRDGK